MRVAVFDVDRTILDGMSGFLFSQYLWRTGAMPWAGRWRASRAFLLHRFGFDNGMVIVEAGVTCCGGLAVAKLETLAAAAVKATMSGRLYREALARIAAHRAAGELVLLASGSNEVVVRALAREVGADDGIGTRGAIVNGRHTAHMEWPPCVAEGKRELVRRWLAERGLAMAKAIAYTDNGIDIPLLDAVGEAVAVNPDEELARYAATRGLPVEAWITPVDPHHRRTGTSWPLRG